MPTKETLVKILTALEGAGGEVFVVGGPVRDRMLSKTPKDIDFLVRKLTLEQIAVAIRTLGAADEVGKSFGVVKGTIDGEVFDFAIPRIREVKTGVSHTDFAVETDPMASVESDLGRRDFTINAMAVPLRSFLEGTVEGLIDPFGGLEDLKAGVLRAVGDPVARFTEDPLRMLRALQFATRLGFVIEGRTIGALVDMRGMLKSVSGERVLEEFKKAWTKGRSDGTFIKLLKLTKVGETLFGSDFAPLEGAPKGLEGDDVVMGMLLMFFLRGGNVSAMKPEAVHVKFLEVARKAAFSFEQPHTFIGNVKPLLPVLLSVAQEIEGSGFSGFAAKVEKMIATPLTAKELDVTGEELIVALDIKSPKEGKRIGEAQRAMLAALWAGTLVNEKNKLLAFARQ